MRSFGRILFHAAAGLSLLLFLVACAAWVGSGDGIFFYSQRWAIHGSSETHFEQWVFSVGGRLGIAHRETTRTVAAEEIPAGVFLAAHPQFRWTLDGSDGRVDWGDNLTGAPRTHGVGGYWRNGRERIPAGNYRESTVAAFWPVVVFAIGPLWWLGRRRIRRWPTWKGLVAAHVLASYGFFGVLLLWWGAAGHTPVFWISGALAPVGAPFVLFDTTLESRHFGIGLFLMWLSYALPFVAMLAVRHRVAAVVRTCRERMKLESRLMSRQRLQWWEHVRSRGRFRFVCGYGGGVGVGFGAGIAALFVGVSRVVYGVHGDWGVSFGLALLLGVGYGLAAAVLLWRGSEKDYQMTVRSGMVG